MISDNSPGDSGAGSRYTVRGSSRYGYMPSNKILNTHYGMILQTNTNRHIFGQKVNPQTQEMGITNLKRVRVTRLNMRRINTDRKKKRHNKKNLMGGGY